jgi:hypothetical protein
MEAVTDPFRLKIRLISNLISVIFGVVRENNHLAFEAYASMISPVWEPVFVPHLMPARRGIFWN